MRSEHRTILFFQLKLRYDINIRIWIYVYYNFLDTTIACYFFILCYEHFPNTEKFMYIFLNCLPGAGKSSGCNDI